MIKILFCADTHLGYDYTIRKRGSRRKRGEDFFQNFQNILDRASEPDIDLLLHGGDFFFRSKVPSIVVDKAYSMIYDFAEKGKKIVIVPGNHERAVLPTSFLTNHPNIFIFDEPKTFFFTINEAIISIAGFPNVRENIKFNFQHLLRQATEGNPFSDIKLLLLHQAIEDSKIAGFTFRFGKDVLPQDLLPDDYEAILSGHIHRAQIIQMEKGNRKIPIIYPGSIERTSVAEINEEKGYYILEFEEIDLEWILSDIVFQKLKTRQMVKLDIDLLTEDENVVRNWLEAEISKNDKDAVIRIRCDIPQTRKLLTAKLIREITTPEMTITLAPVYKKRKGK